MAKLSAAALIASLALVATTGSARPSATAAAPLLQVTPNELRLREPVVALAAEGGRAAFAFCNQLVGVWRPGAGVTRLGLPAQFACPPPRGLERVFSLAIAGDRVAWAAGAGGNQVTNLLFLVILNRPQQVKVPILTAYCCRGSDPDQERLGDVYGDGDFIAFGSRLKCGDSPNAPGCPTGARRLIMQSVWRLRRPPFRAFCVGGVIAPCTALAAMNEEFRPLSVDSGRVAVRRTRGVFFVLDTAGKLVRRLRPVPDVDPAVELMGGRAVVGTPGRLRVYSIASGAQLSSRALPNVATGGVCGMPPCPQVVLRLVDAARGLVAYIHSGQLHLLRLRDGRDRVVAAANDARFGDSGLFYSYTGAAPWVARIRHVRWSALPVTP